MSHGLQRFILQQCKAERTAEHESRAHEVVVEMRANLNDGTADNSKADKQSKILHNFPL